MPLPSVDADAVAAYAPLAPAVTDEDVLSALDWAEQQFERVHLGPPASNTRQGRELVRAICAYALYVHANAQAAGSRGTATAATKAITIGSIKVEKAAVDVEAQAAGLVTSASSWRAAAWRHLVAAGVPRPNWAAGASA